MRKLIAIIIVLIFFSSFSLQTKASDDLFDIDYNFIDTAFDGIQPISDKQFNDTVNKLTPKPVPNTFLGRLKTFLLGREYGVEPVNNNKKETEIDLGGEKEAIKNIQQGIYYIKLLVSVVGTDGNIIPLGNYKVKEKENNLIFYQGSKEYGSLKLRKFEDNLKNENDIAYSRVDIISDNVIRVVYSTIRDTKCAYARVYLQN